MIHLKEIHLRYVVSLYLLLTTDLFAQNGNNGNGSSEDIRPVHKRIRMLSDSEPESSPVKFDNLNLPLAEEIEKKVSFLQNAYPDMDPMVLQDTLKYVG